MLETLVNEGMIRTYGWSTDRADAVLLFGPARMRRRPARAQCARRRQRELLALCDEADLASMNRGPLGMGLLTGKFTPNSTFATDDQRHAAQWHPGLHEGRLTAEWLDKLAAIRDVLDQRRPTLAQGSPAWIWARSPHRPDPRVQETVAQVEENCGALTAGPPSADQMAQIDRIPDRLTTRSTVEHNIASHTAQTSWQRWRYRPGG